MLFRVAGVGVLLCGCTKHNPKVCCETVEQCETIGTTDLLPCADDLVCVDNACVVRPDAAIDAPIDAPGIVAFEVAYPKEWSFSVAGPVSGYFIVVASGGHPVDMGTLELKSIEDDHPTAIVRVTVDSAPSQVIPGFAGGKLSPLSESVLVSSGLVTESRTETSSDYLTLALQSAPQGAYDINANVELAIEGRRFPLHLLIHMMDTPIVYADPILGTRQKVFE